MATYILLLIPFHPRSWYPKLLAFFFSYYNCTANSNICSTVKIEKPESLVAKIEATFSSPNLQPTATTIDARHLQGFQNQQFGEVCESAYSALKGIIYALIGKKRLNEAVGLIYNLKLLEKFPPGQIIKEYVDNGKKWCRIRIKRKKTLDEKVRTSSLLWTLYVLPK